MSEENIYHVSENRGDMSRAALIWARDEVVARLVFAPSTFIADGNNIYFPGAEHEERRLALDVGELICGKQYEITRRNGQGIEIKLLEKIHGLREGKHILSFEHLNVAIEAFPKRTQQKKIV